MKLQCMKCSVIACAVYLASVGIESLNMFPSPHILAWYIKHTWKKSWYNKYLHAQQIPRGNFWIILEGAASSNNNRGRECLLPSMASIREEGAPSQVRAGQGRSSFSPSKFHFSLLCIPTALQSKLNWSFLLPLSQGSAEASKDMQPAHEEWTPAISQRGAQCLQDPSVQSMCRPFSADPSLQSTWTPPSVKEARYPASFANWHKDKEEQEGRRKFDYSHRSINFLNWG